jgi:hypothetical protein
VPTPYTRKPLTWLTRRIEDYKHLSIEGKSHVLNWTADISKRVPDDPRLQAVAQAAVMAYLQIVQIEEALLKLSATSPQADKLGNSMTKWVRQLTFCLRLAGLRRVAQQAITTKRRQVFTTATPRAKDGADEPEDPTKRDGDGAHQDEDQAAVA